MAYRTWCWVEKKFVSLQETEFPGFAIGHNAVHRDHLVVTWSTSLAYLPIDVEDKKDGWGTSSGRAMRESPGNQPIGGDRTSPTYQIG